MAENVPTHDRVFVQAGQIDGHARPRARALHGISMRLKAAGAGPVPCRKNLELVPHYQSTRYDRPRHDRTEAVPREDAVHGHAEQALRRTDGRPLRQGEEGRTQLVEPGPRTGGDTQDGSLLQERAGHELARLHLGEGLRLRVRQVALGEDDEAAGDPEQPADREVLAGLGHDRLVGGHHEEDGVQAVGPREHVADEALVAGDVHEGHDRGAAEGEVGEAQVDGDAALPLLLQPIRVGAGEGEDERALPVVDVAGGPDDDRARLSLPWWSRRTRTPRSCAAWRRGRAGPPSPSAR